MLTPVRPNPPRCEVNGEVLDYVVRIEGCCDCLAKRNEKLAESNARYAKLLGDVIFEYATDINVYLDETDQSKREWLKQRLLPGVADFLGEKGMSSREIITLMSYSSNGSKLYELARERFEDDGLAED